MEVTLNIGCGEKKDEGMVGLDIRLTAAVDVLADARSLPFRDGSFNRVFSSHTIEHFGHSETHGLLSEWVRVLKIGGTMEIRCPDLKVRSLLFFLRSDQLNVKYIYGRQDYEGNYHKSGFSYGLLKRELTDAGLGGVRRVYGGFRGLPLIPNDLHVTALKKHVGSNSIDDGSSEKPR